MNRTSNIMYTTHNGLCRRFYLLFNVSNAHNLQHKTTKTIQTKKLRMFLMFSSVLFQDQCCLLLIHTLVFFFALHTCIFCTHIFSIAQSTQNQLLLFFWSIMFPKQTNPFYFSNFLFTVRKDLELRLKFRFFNNLHRKSAKIQ